MGERDLGGWESTVLGNLTRVGSSMMNGKNSESTLARPFFLVQTLSTWMAITPLSQVRKLRLIKDSITCLCPHSWLGQDPESPQPVFLTWRLHCCLFTPAAELNAVMFYLPRDPSSPLSARLCVTCPQWRSCSAVPHAASSTTCHAGWFCSKRLIVMVT